MTGFGRDAYTLRKERLHGVLNDSHLDLEIMNDKPTQCAQSHIHTTMAPKAPIGFE